MSKLYLAGRMSHLPQHNFPRFHQEAARLRSLGFEVINPAEINADETNWLLCMRADIHALIECDGIALLENWELSRGARLELEIAQRLGLTINLCSELI